MTMREDDKLLMELATPSNVEQAMRLLRHPLVQALEFCEAETARTGSEFYRRLAGSLRKAHAELVATGRA